MEIIVYMPSFPTVYILANIVALMICKWDINMVVNLIW
jgi:hypothetical protein